MDRLVQGVGFLITHASGLSCSGRYPSGHLPEQFSVEIKCNDELTGLMNATKAEGVRGVVTLSDERQGDVAFVLPVPVIQPSPRVATAHRTYVRHGRGGCGSRGGPGYRLPNGKCARWSHRRH